MNFSEYYTNKMTEGLEKKETEMWKEFYSTVLPKRIEKFKKKFAGKPEDLEEAVNKFERDLIQKREETYICSELDREYERLRETFYRDAIARLDALGAQPDKAGKPAAGRVNQPSGNVIAELKEENRKLEKKLQEANKKADELQVSLNTCDEQKRVLMMWSDIATAATRIDDIELLKSAYGFMKGCVKQQREKDLEDENDGL